MAPRKGTVEQGIMAGDLEPVQGETTALHHRFWSQDPSRSPDKSRAQHHKMQKKARYQDEAAHRDDLTENKWR